MGLSSTGFATWQLPVNSPLLHTSSAKAIKNASCAFMLARSPLVVEGLLDPQGRRTCPSGGLSVLYTSATSINLIVLWI